MADVVAPGVAAEGLGEFVLRGADVLGDGLSEVGESASGAVVDEALSDGGEEPS